MDNLKLRSVFFKIVSKEEALKLWKKQEVFILYDDMSESLIESESEIQDTTYPLGVELPNETRKENKYKVLSEIYHKLEVITEMNDLASSVKISLLTIMEELDYLESLGLS